MCVAPSAIASSMSFSSRGSRGNAKRRLGLRMYSPMKRSLRIATSTRRGVRCGKRSTNSASVRTARYSSMSGLLSRGKNRRASRCPQDFRRHGFIGDEAWQYRRIQDNAEQRRGHLSVLPRKPHTVSRPHAVNQSRQFSLAHTTGTKTRPHRRHQLVKSCAPRLLIQGQSVFNQLLCVTPGRDATGLRLCAQSRELVLA